jgi:hypothetical protein
MTMHLLGPQYNNTAARKRKSAVKLTGKFISDFNDYNRNMRRIGSSEMSLSDYVLYRQGKLKPSTKKGKPLTVEYNVSDHRTRYPSSGDGIGVSAPKREQVYTGTFIKGIGTMHKSNSVPITNDEDAIAIARMRRS